MSVIFLNSFSKSTYFLLYEAIFIFKFFSLSLKSLYFTKVAILFLLAKFTCANLAEKFCAVNMLNSCGVI